MIKTINLEKTFYKGNITTPVLKGIDLEIKSGEFVAIMGRSGAGKSTLMYQISLLDEPTGGEIFIEDFDLSKASIKERTDYRLNNFGFVFQDYALIPELTAVENVMLPLLMRGENKIEAHAKSLEALHSLDLHEQVDNLPSQLSGGEQQRVSLARAIVHKPKILFADEPTANLDSESAGRVIDILVDLNKGGQTVVMITHELEYGKRAKRIVTLGAGKIDTDKMI